MKFYFLFSVLTISAFFATAQTDSTGKKVSAFSCYMNVSSHYETTYESSLIQEKNNVSFGGLSIAFYRKKHIHLMHEFELMPLLITSHKDMKYYVNSNRFNSVSGSEITNYKAYLKYHLYYSLFDKQKKWNPFLGFSTGLIFSKTVYLPLDATSFLTRTSQYIIPFDLIPGIRHSVSDQMSFVIKTPIIINELYIEHSNVSNPALPIKLRSRTIFYGMLLPKTICLQLGLRFNLK